MDVTFPGNLTVITGETGAGKSIFLEALGLALGKRADTSSLQNKSKKCVIEAEFNVRQLDLSSFFEAEGLDQDDQIILRREISAEGKSRSFLNDTPVSLAALKSLSEKLIDIHSQHQTLLLNHGNFQLEMIDAFAGTIELFREYRQEFHQLSKSRSALQELEEQESKARKELDYLQFLFSEFDETKVVPGNLKQLENEASLLEHAESIRSHLSAAAGAISAGDSNLLSGLAQARQALLSATKLSEKYKDYYDRINTAYIELKELSGDLESAAEDIVSDPARLDEINAGIDKLNRLMKKHQVKSEEELLASKNEIESKLQSFGSLETDIADTRKKILNLENSCLKKATQISELRHKALKEIENTVTDILADLSMPHASFKIDLQKLSSISASGIDQINFLFSANKGGSLNELQKVASGGELSRLMLALKSLLATKKELPTIIFDEIDSGVSGDVADKIGIILGKMGKRMQVITITHLPQIASKGKHHLFVYKQVTGEKTSSLIRELIKDERVTEIAKMLSTGQPTASALKNAQDLLRVN